MPTADPRIPSPVQRPDGALSSSTPRRRSYAVGLSRPDEEAIGEILMWFGASKGSATPPILLGTTLRLQGRQRRSSGWSAMRAQSGGTPSPIHPAEALRMILEYPTS